jgi:hypothetical protein
MLADTFVPATGSLERLMEIVRLDTPLDLCRRNPIWEIDGNVLTPNAPFSETLGKKFF